MKKRLLLISNILYAITVLYAIFVLVVTYVSSSKLPDALVKIQESRVWLIAGIVALVLVTVFSVVVERAVKKEAVDSEETTDDSADELTVEDSEEDVEDEESEADLEEDDTYSDSEDEEDK